MIFVAESLISFRDIEMYNSSGGMAALSLHHFGFNETGTSFSSFTSVIGTVKSPFVERSLGA